MRSYSAWLVALLMLLTACSTAPSVTPQAAGSTPQAPTPTWTPAPFSTSTEPFALPLPESLTTVELHERLDPFGSVSEGCVLPCYNSCVPGEATMEEALVFYSRLGIGVPDLIPGDYQDARDGTGHLGAWLTKSTDVVHAEEIGLAPPVVDIYLEDNVVQYIYTGWEYAPPYLTLPVVLENLGEPDRIDLGLVLRLDPAAYILQFVYADVHAGFLFKGDTTGDANRRQVCFSDEQVAVTYFGVFSPDVTPMEGLAGSHYLLPLEESLGLSYADLAALVAAGGCLEIPAERWSLWQELEQ